MLMVKRLIFSLLLFGVGVSLPAYSQEKKPGETDEIIRVDTQLVDVPISAVNAKGIPLGGLKATNFIVYEDGKKQEIVDFSATSEPFEVALLLDTSGSTRSELNLIKRAANDFIASLRPGDRVAIIAYKTEIESGRAFAASEVFTPLTGDREKLRSAVDNISTSNGTPYYDSLLQVVEKVFAVRPTGEYRGRRTLVALTDGVDSTSASDFSLARSDLEQAGIITFFIKVDTRNFFEEQLLGNCELAIRFSAAQLRRYYRSFGPKNPNMTTNFCDLGEFERLAVSKRLYQLAEAEMDEMAKLTGGKVFPVGDFNEARSAFKSVAEEIGTKYTLGYYSTNEKRDGTFRKIKVEAKGLPAGTVIRAREGYTAPVK
jgi:Ca-activated chloride channel family protein